MRPGGCRAAQEAVLTLRQAVVEASGEVARRDAEVLLLHVLRQHLPAADRAWLLAHAEEPLDPPDHLRFCALIARRAAHEPLQHLTGVQEFFGLALRVTRDTLIPRPETEHLVEAVLLWATQSHAEQMLRIADVGTGSGAIAIALATHLAGAGFLAIDSSAAALSLAEENARAHSCLDRIRFVRSDLLEVVLAEMGAEDGAAAPLDAVVSNPPYVPLSDLPGLQPEVAGFEPHAALFGGEDGLAVYRRLIPQAHAALRPGGLLALEFGFGQRAAMCTLLGEAAQIAGAAESVGAADSVGSTKNRPAWRNVRFLDDYAGIPRVALAERA